VDDELPDAATWTAQPDDEPDDRDGIVVAPDGHIQLA